ncbi:zinc finger protein 839 [Polymixia lowei]
MADNEDESNLSSPIPVVGDSSGTATQVQCVSEVASNIDPPAVPVDELTNQNQNQTGEKIIAASTAELAVAQGSTDFLQSCTAKHDGESQVVTQIVSSEQVEQNIFVGTSAEVAAGTEFTTISADIVNALSPNTTIIYVQPDGSFVEGSGLTAEEHQALVEQLTKQQIVQVSEIEAARLFEQNQVIKTIPATTTQFVPNAALAPNELQQVIDQVTKSQQQQQQQQQQATIVQASQQSQVAVKPMEQQVLTTVDASGLFTLNSHAEVTGSPRAQTNASQQLKNVAKQVAMQSSSPVLVLPKKSEPIRIQIQVPPKQEVKPLATITLPQQKSLAVNQQQVKVSANGNMTSSQIIHIQPMVSQQGQQFFLQQNPGEPPIQLLLQSPGSVVGSLVPVVQKLTGQQTTTVPLQKLMGQQTVTGPVQKPVTTPVRLQTPAIIKTPLISTVKTVPVPLVKPPANGTTTVSIKCPVKSPVAIAAPTATSTPAPVNTTTPSTAAALSTAKEREKDKKTKAKEKKPLKIQTRSGRVSRPPKYKAKDYKFIKNEDLAESHQSDSDDYSEMSVEEEEEGEEGEEGKKEGASSSSSSSTMTYSHKSRAFQCQSCDKAYIGHAGLSRHYKLNPTHGEPDPPTSTTKEPQRDPELPDKKAGKGGELQEEEKQTNSLETEKANKTSASSLLKGDGGPAAAVGLRGLQPRGPGRPRGRGRGRGRSVMPPPKVVVGHPGRRGRRGRPPKLGGAAATAEQQAERRRERLEELVEQCEDEELMEVVLPRLAKALTLWELLLAKVGKGGLTKTHFPEMYREFESLQGHVRKVAQEYISNPQSINSALEVRNIEVAKSLGIFDEVNKLKVVPGSPKSSANLAAKTVRYMENSKMLPPSKRFKMENSIPIHQNGVESSRKAETSTTPVAPAAPTLKSCSVSVSPLVVPAGSGLLSSMASSSSSLSNPTPTGTFQPQSSATSTSAPPTTTLTELIQDDLSNSLNQEAPDSQGEPMETSAQEVPLHVKHAGHIEPLGTEDQVLSSSDIAAQMKALEKALGSQPEPAAVKQDSEGGGSAVAPTQEEQQQTGSAIQNQTPPSSELSAPPSKPPTTSTSLPQQSAPSQAVVSGMVACEAKGLQGGKEIYIQTENLTVEPAQGTETQLTSDQIVIVNGPDGTTMHIRTPEGVPLEAVHALLGIEAVEAGRAQQ